MSTHAAAQAVTATKVPLNDTKAIIESTTGISRKAPAITPSEDKDTPKAKWIEAFPVYLPIGGITLRVGRHDGEPSYWTDMSVKEAEQLIADLRAALKEVHGADAPNAGDSVADPDDAPDTKPAVKAAAKSWKSPTTGRTYVPLEWVVRDHGADDPVEHVGKFAAVNNKNDSIVWFGKRDLAEEITERLNKR